MTNKRYDVLGIGFGPANIALAAALEDEAELHKSHGLGKIIFLERAINSRWQPGMLIRETDIQHHFLRDLATPRNPRSRFTFANYLKEKGRIFEFGELLLGAAGGAVSRLEWSDYINWAAQQLQDYSNYNQAVISVQPIIEKEEINRLSVQTKTDIYETKDLVVACGRAPNIPQLFEPHLGPQVFHSVNFLTHLGFLDQNPRLTVTVIGSGQNAAEILCYIHDHYPLSRLISIHRSIGFKHVDLCEFSNEVFHPEETDFFHGLVSSHRAQALEEMWGTNYGVIDQEVSASLYRKYYEDLVLENKRMEFMKRNQIVDCQRSGQGFLLTVKNKYSAETKQFYTDVVILSTGFYEPAIPEFLAPLKDYLILDESSKPIEMSSNGIDERLPIVDRNYQLLCSKEFKSRIYFLGLTEKSHGISNSTSFSMMAIKAEQVLRSLQCGRMAQQCIAS